MARAFWLSGWLAWLVALPLAATAAMPPQMLVFRVSVDAGGRVVAATPLDERAAPALRQAAEAYARKLVFTPARKAGAPVPSQTHLSLVLATRPAGDGRFALYLERAVSGPGVAKLVLPPKPKLRGEGQHATVIARVDVGANGEPDMDSFEPVSVKLREDFGNSEARFLDAVRVSVRHTRFLPDLVDGAPVPARLTLPYRFGRGGDKPPEGQEERGRDAPPPDPGEQPVMQAESLDPNIQLPKVDYKSSGTA
jgi:hypothetical protein